IRTDTSWTAGLPIVVSGGLLVHPQATLTITEGARIYLHADAPLLIYGRLLALGGPADSTRIIFQGDRLDTYYREHPGAWPGIYFLGESEGNLLDRVVIRNAYQGVVVRNTGAVPAGPHLQVRNTV